MEALKIVIALLVAVLGIFRLRTAWEIWATWSEVKVKSIREKQRRLAVVNFILGCTYLAMALVGMMDALNICGR